MQYGPVVKSLINKLKIYSNKPIENFDCCVPEFDDDKGVTIRDIPFS